MFAVGMALAVIGGLLLVFVWALCRVAAISDEQMRKMIKGKNDGRLPD